jgi:hypothetical protein
MSKRTPLHNERALAERLCREAKQSRPEFSESLHARICRAIEECPRQQAPIWRRGPLAHLRQEPSRHPGAARHRLSVWASVAVAAACLACVAMVAWPKNEIPGGPSADGNGQSGLWAESSAPTLDLESVAGLAMRVSDDLRDWVDSAAATQRWAYLDGDARLAVEMLAARLPFDVASSLASTEAPAGPR